MIIDSQMTLTDALVGTKAPNKVAEQMKLIDVEYYSFDDEIHRGQLVVYKEFAKEITVIFNELKKYQFPIEKVVPIVAYDWDDTASMSDNNSSAFNYRFIAGTERLSNHSFGQAIDINPRNNPYINKNGIAQPEGCVYNPNVKGTIIDGDKVVKIFLKHGWVWGGHWGKTRGYFDYQHFEKVGSDLR